MNRILNKDNLRLSRKGVAVKQYDWQTSADLAADAGLEDFACHMRVLAKGEYSYPYHYHLGAEEMITVISGCGKLRDPEGIRELGAGDTVFFAKGPEGAHQLYNPFDEPFVYLDLRTIKNLDICEYPDTGKVNILPAKDIFRRGEAKDYFDGEEHPEKNWPSE